MQASRIAELLDPFLGPPDARRLAPEAFDHISTYIDLLQRWNARINLTAIRNEEEIVTRHFGESLFAARRLFPLQKNNSEDAPPLSRCMRQGRDFELPAGADIAPSNPPTEANQGDVTVADVGSGAGFPGIPIKLWAPEISLTLIESNHKKATFLREVARALTLTDVNIQTTRAESLSNLEFEVVTLRAVERFELTLPTAAGLLAREGRLALLIGESQLSQAHSLLPSLNWSAGIPIPHSKSRVLAIATNP